MKKIMKKLLILAIVSLFTVSAYAGSAVDSYLDGTQKVCVYEDGYKVQVGITDICPIIHGH